jgi:DNA-binding Lrp family transcriptional regulator
MGTSEAMICPDKDARHVAAVRALGGFRSPRLAPRPERVGGPPFTRLANFAAGDPGPSHHAARAAAAERRAVSRQEVEARILGLLEADMRTPLTLAQALGVGPIELGPILVAMKADGLIEHIERGGINAWGRLGTNARLAEGYVRLEAKVLEALTRAGADGLAPSELGRRVGVPPGHLSGPLSKLRRAGVIARAGEGLPWRLVERAAA